MPDCAHTPDRRTTARTGRRDTLTEQVADLATTVDLAPILLAKHPDEVCDGRVNAPA